MLVTPVLGTVLETCGPTGELFERCNQQEVGTRERRTPDSVLASDFSSEEAGRAQEPWSRDRFFLIYSMLNLRGQGRIIWRYPISHSVWN